MATNQKKIEKTDKNLICDDTSTENHLDESFEYYKHPKSKVMTNTYNYHTINHIELTDKNKQKLLFKFEGIPILNEKKYQVDLYERSFRYCDYSFKYLVIKSKYSKEESNQIIEKPLDTPSSKFITGKFKKKLKTVVEIDESETFYEDVYIDIKALTEDKGDNGSR